MEGGESFADCVVTTSLGQATEEREMFSKGNGDV